MRGSSRTLEPKKSISLRVSKPCSIELQWFATHQLVVHLNDFPWGAADVLQPFVYWGVSRFRRRSYLSSNPANVPGQVTPWIACATSLFIEPTIGLTRAAAAYNDRLVSSSFYRSEARPFPTARPTITATLTMNHLKVGRPGVPRDPGTTAPTSKVFGKTPVRVPRGR